MHNRGIIRAGLALCGAGMLGSFLHITTLSHYTREGYDFIGSYSLAFLFYLLALLITWRAKDASLWLIMGFAVICRVVLWVDEPTLSSDVWRYIWDGRLITEQVNIYSYRVDAPELEPLRTPLYDNIEHTNMASPYPPAAHVAFGVTVAVQPESATAMQVVFTLFDLATGILILLLLRDMGRDKKWVLLYVWNPLIIVEFAHGAHIDSMMTFFIVLAFWLHIYSSKVGSSLSLAAAVLTKYIPAILLPVFIRHWHVRYTLLFGLVITLGFLPFLSAGLGIGTQDDGSGIFGAVRIYTNDWKTNDGFFYWLVERLSPLVENPLQIARLISNVLLLATGGIIMLLTPANASIQRQIAHAAILIGVYLLLASAMFPWYLTWLIALLPFLPFERHMPALLFTMGWLYFSWAVNLSYLFYLDPQNPGEVMWIRNLEYIPLSGFLSGAMLFTIREQMLQWMDWRWFISGERQPS